MTSELSLYFLNHAKKNNTFGGKGNSLFILKKMNILTPESVFFDLNEIENYILNQVKNYNFLRKKISFWNLTADQEEPLELNQLRSSILEIQKPKNWLNLFNTIQSCLGNGVIVRSSMNIEDHENNSFAGCFASHVVLNLSEDNLWNIILKVLSSAYTKSSVLRILESGLSLTEIKVGFFLQKFINSIYAGVSFSRNPSQLWEKSGLVEWGATGEQVVQGKGVVKSAFEYKASPFELKDFWQKLWFYNHELENKFSSPVDIEWVWDGVQLWIVQVRMIATAEAQIIKFTKENKTWNREETLERFPEPLTPLGWSAIEGFLFSNLQILKRDFGIIIKNFIDVGLNYGGYIYMNPKLFKFPDGIKIRFWNYLSPFKSSFWKLLYILFSYPILYLGYYRKFNKKIIFKIKIVNILFGRKADFQIRNWDSHCIKYLEKINNFNNKIKNINEFDSKEILYLCEEFTQLSKSFMEPDLAIYFLKGIYFKLLKEIWLNFKLPEQNFLDLVNSFEGNRTLKMSEEWENLVTELRSDEKYTFFIEKLEQSSTFEEALLVSECLHPVRRNMWISFLDRNGHIRTSWDLIKPCWRENPSQLVFLLKQFNSDFSKNIVKNGSRKEKAHELLFATLKKNGLSFLITKVQKNIFRLENLMKIDEEQHFISGILLEPSRKLVLLAENIFLSFNQLKEPGSVFFLTLDELKIQLNSPSFNLHFMTQRRKQQWELSRLNPKPMELPPLPETRMEQVLNLSVQETNSTFVGLPASPGIATGPIHFIEHIEDVKNIPQGAILVTTSPNPSFVPLYPMLAGIITVTGGALSHGFVAAREYGLPAVSGINNTRIKFTSGMVVKIDGTQGLVSKQ